MIEAAADLMSPKPDDVPLGIVDPERIPARRYYDQTFFELENEHMWLRSWQMACRLEEIPALGDWVEYKVLDKSVIVVRTADGVKAFHNACRHRGMKLAHDRGNCAKTGFICPFHGWRYTGEGRNSFVYGRGKFSENALDPADLDLVPCRVELWGGCAFVNLDADALPFADHIRGSAARLDPRELGEMKIEWWLSTVLPCNWKLAMEAFMEGYHQAKTHPQLLSPSMPAATMMYGALAGAPPVPRTTIDAATAIEATIDRLAILGEGMAGMVHPNDIEVARSIQNREWPADPMEAVPQFYRALNQEITARGRAKGLPMPDFNALAADNPASSVEYVFPNYFMLPQFGNMSSYRVRPLGPESCLFELWSLSLYPDKAQSGPIVAPVPTPYTDPDWPLIPKQDYDNLPNQQEGLHSIGFEHMRLSHEIEGLISNYHRLIDGFIGGVDRTRLAAASSIVSSPLDVPITDIGF